MAGRGVVRDLDGRRRLVKASRPGRREAEVALQERLAQRRPLGFRGVEPSMIVQELGEYWMRRCREEARVPSTAERRGEDTGVVSLQTLAGYQSALSGVINPRLGGLRLLEARTGVVDEALAQVDLSGRTTRVARGVLVQMFAVAARRTGEQPDARGPAISRARPIRESADSEANATTHRLKPLLEENRSRLGLHAAHSHELCQAGALELGVFSKCLVNEGQGVAADESVRALVGRLCEHTHLPSATSGA